MSVLHHPADEWLLSYAAGAADEAMSLILATHLALCPQCRRTVAQAEAAGGALLESGDGAPLTADALGAVMAQLDEPVQKTTLAERTPSNVPQPLRSYIGGDLDAVRWTNIAGGISFAPLFKRGSEQVRLIRSRPGAGVGLHSHRGEEFTLCLTGGYTDETGQYARGDLQFATSEILHRPIADEGEDCIVLAVSDAPLLFRSFGISLIAKWFGF